MNPTLAEIGAELRQAREAKQLSLEELSHMTLVHVRHLAALEEGRSQDLPEPFYVKNFIRKYANALGLSGDEFANRYWDTRPLPPPPPVASHAPDLNVSWWIFPVLVGALMLGVIVTLVILNVRHSRERVLAIASPAPSAQVAVATALASRPASASHLPVRQTAVASAPVAAAPGVSGTLPVAALASGTTGVPGSSPSAAAVAAAIASGSSDLPPVVVKEPKIVFQTHNTEASWMHIVADGREVQSDDVPAGKTRKWTAHRSLLVRIGNPGAVYGTLDGQSLGQLASRDTSVYRRTFLTAEGAADAKKTGHAGQSAAHKAKPSPHASAKPKHGKSKPHPSATPTARPDDQPTDAPDSTDASPVPSADPGGQPDSNN